MSVETNVNWLISYMDARLHKDVYAFAHFDGPIPATLPFIMAFAEAEGMTAIVKEDDAIKIGATFTYPCRMITLNVLSSLEAVGLMARVTGALAENGISVNPVSAFYHDHLFVPIDQAGLAMFVLRRMAETQREANIEAGILDPS